MLIADSITELTPVSKVLCCLSDKCRFKASSVLNLHKARSVVRSLPPCSNKFAIERVTRNGEGSELMRVSISGAAVVQEDRAQ